MNINFIVTGVEKIMTVPGQPINYGGMNLGITMSTALSTPPVTQPAAPIEVYAVKLQLSGGIFGIASVVLIVDKSELASYPMDGTGVWVSPGAATVPV